VTHRPIRTEPDGTRVYVGGHRYKPKSDAERKNRRRKPDDPRAVRWQGEWLLPLDLLPDNRRSFPITRPDTDAYEHMKRTAMCMCDVCIRPQADRWRAKWRREQARSRPRS
jgi:hypothetical protein